MLGKIYHSFPDQIPCVIPSLEPSLSLVRKSIHLPTMRGLSLLLAGLVLSAEAATISKDARCGAPGHDATCLNSAWGSCCSQYGWWLVIVPTNSLYYTHVSSNTNDRVEQWLHKRLLQRRLPATLRKLQEYRGSARDSRFSRAACVQ